MKFIYSAKKGVEFLYIHVLLDELWKYSCTIDELLDRRLSTFVMDFEYTNLWPILWKMWEGGIGQDPATEVAYLGLNQPPVSSSVSLPCMVILKWHLWIVAMVTSHFISCYILTITKKLCKEFEVWRLPLDVNTIISLQGCYIFKQGS